VNVIDRKLIVEAEKGLSLTPKPFDKIAANLGITPEDAIIRLQKLQENGVIRRFGVSLRPDGVGINANALVAWKVPEKRVGKVSLYFSEHEEVSHCYEREVVPHEWEYNLYTVMHAPERSAIEEMVVKFSEETALTDYVILYSNRNLKELKKC